MAHFWWEQQQNELKIHLVSWNQFCESNPVGSLGFKKLKDFNLALLAKQGWKLTQNQGSLLYRIYKAQYFPHGEFF